MILLVLIMRSRGAKSTCHLLYDKLLGPLQNLGLYKIAPQSLANHSYRCVKPCRRAAAAQPVCHINTRNVPS